jgi:hypothetical protein
LNQNVAHNLNKVPHVNTAGKIPADQCHRFIDGIDRDSFMGNELSRDEICGQQLPAVGIQGVHFFNRLHGVGVIRTPQRNFYFCS